jgi:hypothetical protein
LPETIVFKYQRPGAWFYSEVQDTPNGPMPELMKKEKLKDLTASEIYNGFMRVHEKMSCSDLVAYHIATVAGALHHDALR